MRDQGIGKTKVCFSITPYECDYGIRKRAIYEQGGISEKKSHYSRFNKYMLCFCSSQSKEIISNFKKMLNLLKINEMNHSKNTKILLS